MLFSKLISVCLPYASAFIRPGIPNMTVKFIHVVGFFLPYPKKLPRREIPRYIVFVSLSGLRLGSSDLREVNLL